MTGGWVGPRSGLDAATRKDSLPLPGINPGRPDHSIVTILTDLSRHRIHILVNFILLAVLSVTYDHTFPSRPPTSNMKYHVVLIFILVLKTYTCDYKFHGRVHVLITEYNFKKVCKYTSHLAFNMLGYLIIRKYLF